MNEWMLAGLAGLSIGFLGSFHCIGMCGPLALALPVHELQGLKRYAGIVAYNIGRVVTYGLLGLLFGFFGARFRLWGLQQGVSIGAGLIILFMVISGTSVSGRIKWLGRMNGWINHHLGRRLSGSRRAGHLLVIGLLNGLLPCGLVYLAVAAAVATTDVVHGALLMAGFGLGTIPAMAGLMLAGHRISVPFRQKMRKAVPVMVAVMAVILIFRGLNLGVPMLSPKMEKNEAEIKRCH